ncbi:hypothetical protein ACGFYQ_36105 [Streptomyces sp. NPDC048258]|uniref:hypothetical protein n=1 Tax=Streptomyces sp. NPDC048258 TaxID=3365527 RepID=UPI00371EF691
MWGGGLVGAFFVRFQGPARNSRGHFPGIFALANGLAREGKLSEEEYRFWRAGNDWYDANFTNPSDVDPTVYDHELHPGATAWFKTTAVDLVDRATGYLELLSAHGVACERVESSDPGEIIYEDDEQVVVVPRAAPPDGGV